MKNYLINKQNFKSIAIEVQTDLNNSLVSKVVDHTKKFGTGTITSFEVREDGTSYFNVKFETEALEKKFNLDSFNGFFTTDEATLEELNSYINVINEITKVSTEIRKEKRMLEEKIAREELAKKKAEEEAKKAKIRFEEHKKKVLQSLNRIKKQSVKLDNDFYTTLGWIAGHVGTISASIPDYCESWFVKRFGNVSVNVVDSSQKTSGGYSMKWNPSFSISFTNLDNQPATLEIKNKKINDTSFVFDLVENYGFQFGKTQDIDKILAEIPADKLDNFRLGLNA